MRRPILLLAVLLVPVSAWAMDIDVTSIDRLPNCAFDAVPNQPAAGAAVTFEGHIDLIDAVSPVTADFVWYLDGVALTRGTVTLVPGSNVVTQPWT